jgi:phosphatidylglycerol---prolipoprotein diacylglyceryl transferase
MYPWLLHSPPVSTYGACIVAALIVSWLWARFRARTVAIDPSRIDLLMPVLLGAGLLGAWSFGRLTDALTDEAAHGAVLVGSLLVATAAGVGYALLSRIPLGILGDICATPLALGIAIGRLGCFFAGCCYGKVCPAALGIQFPRGSFACLDQLGSGELSPDASCSLPVYPTQLYESALCCVLALVLWKFLTRLRISGEHFLAMGIGYAVIRFFIEFLRADNPAILRIGNISLTFSQLAAILILIIATATGLVRRRYARQLGLIPAEFAPGPRPPKRLLASVPQHSGDNENQNRPAQSAAQ